MCFFRRPSAPCGTPSAVRRIREIRLDAPLSEPQLRRPQVARCRRRCALVRLGAPGPRPWRSPLHRPSRSLRRHTDRRRPRFAGFRRCRVGAVGMGDQGRRGGEGAVGRHRERQSADRRNRDLRQVDRDSVEGGGAAAAGFRRAGLSGGRSPPLPFPRPPARAAARECAEARGDYFVCPPADDRGRLFRVPNADPDGLVAGGRAGFPGAVAASTRENSTRCRRRHSSSSS